MLVPVIAFAVTYVLMIALPKVRHWVAAASAVFFLVWGGISSDGGLLAALKDAAGAVNWNVLMMLFGTMGTVFFFIESKMPDVMAEKLLRIAPNTMWAVVFISLFSGFISAFMDNVATVLMIAPIGLAVAKQLKISPVDMLICISVSSNLQGAATLVGDTTSIMLGGYADMNFLDFFVFQGRMSVFWAVEFGALATVPVIMLIFRKQRQKVNIAVSSKVEDVVPSILLTLNIVLLIVASFLPNMPETINGIICLAVFAVTAVYSLIRSRGFSKIAASFRDIDYRTLLLLASLFIIIAGVEKAGVLDLLAEKMVLLGGGNLFVIYTIIVWVSVLLSAFIDNIPYVATMLPVVQSIALSMGVAPYVLYFGLLTGATLGGNITPIGASANIAAIGILRKNGYEVKNRQFFRIGLPFTLVAVLTGYLYIWFVWA
ncbi:MAG: arsenic transporter [Oscillospiraceae bacterium]|nr:arsenic transporter [Oscillospiraceae bacterium]